MGRLVYISRNFKSTKNGGGKARVDIEDILSDMGAVNLANRRTFNSSRFIDFTRNITGILKYMLSVKPGDILVLQYPMKKYYRIVCRWARRRGAKTVTLIHDLGSFRRRKLDIDEEIEKLSHTDVIIAANGNTVKWLRDHGCKVAMTEQHVWDYLSPARPSEKEQNRISCVYVGNLRPSFNGFLYSVSPDVELHLYGDGAPEKHGENVVCHGFADPDDIIANACGRYGLVWYGQSLIHDGKGYVGEYIRYCNSHKLALYVRAGKPVIMWRHAGEASFVEEQGIGILVDDLKDLDSRLAVVTDEEYRKMLGNVKRVSAQMANGDYIRRAVAEAGAILGDRI